jgi:hypothetical protein
VGAGARGHARGRGRRPGARARVDLAFSIGQREADLLRLQLNQYAEIPQYKLDPEVWEQLAEADATGRRMRHGDPPPPEQRRTWVEVPVVGATRRRIERQREAAIAAGVTVLLFDRDSGLPWTMPNLEAGQRRFIRRFAELRQVAIDDAARPARTSSPARSRSCSFAISAAPRWCSWASSGSPTS